MTPNRGGCTALDVKSITLLRVFAFSDWAGLDAFKQQEFANVNDVRGGLSVFNQCCLFGSQFIFHSCKSFVCSLFPLEVHVSCQQTIWRWCLFLPLHQHLQLFVTRLHFLTGLTSFSSCLQVSTSIVFFIIDLHLPDFESSNCFRRIIKQWIV